MLAAQERTRTDQRELYSRKIVSGSRPVAERLSAGLPPRQGLGYTRSRSPTPRDAREELKTPRQIVLTLEDARRIIAAVAA